MINDPVKTIKCFTRDNKANDINPGDKRWDAGSTRGGRIYTCAW